MDIITSEAEVFDGLWAMDRAAKNVGVMLLPGTGFDVVPSDCLAAHLKSRCPDATHLELAFRGRGGGVSHGTATTMVENIHRGGMVRQDGRLRRVATAWKTREILTPGFQTPSTAYGKDLVLELPGTERMDA